jgi:peptidoglycan/LPS O-acetylase OafA/YrhL
MHLATFVFGLVLGLLFEQQRERIRPFAGLMMLIAVVVFLALILIPNSIVKYHHNGLFAPIFGLFVVGLASAPHLQISRIFSRRPFVLLGEASYGIYILQVPLYLGYAPVAQRLSMSPGFHFWSYYAALVLASLASFQWIERPARKRIRSYYQSRLQKHPV